jgi:hypothetical protein
VSGRPAHPASRGFHIKVFVLALMVVVALSGCAGMSYQAPSPAFTPEAQCVRYGGRWHPGFGSYAFCERTWPAN